MVSTINFEAALSETTCRESFQRFKSGDFDVEDRHGGEKEKMIEDPELEELLAEDTCTPVDEVEHTLFICDRWPRKIISHKSMLLPLGAVHRSTGHELLLHFNNNISTFRRALP